MGRTFSWVWQFCRHQVSFGNVYKYIYSYSCDNTNIRTHTHTYCATTSRKWKITSCCLYISFGAFDAVVSHCHHCCTMLCIATPLLLPRVLENWKWLAVLRHRAEYQRKVNAYNTINPIAHSNTAVNRKSTAGICLPVDDETHTHTHAKKMTFNNNSHNDQNRQNRIINDCFGKCLRVHVCKCVFLSRIAHMFEFSHSVSAAPVSFNVSGEKSVLSTMDDVSTENRVWSSDASW